MKERTTIAVVKRMDREREKKVMTQLNKRIQKKGMIAAVYADL